MVKRSNILQPEQGKYVVLGIVLTIITYWMFAQTFLNLGPHLENTFDTSQGVINLSISLTSLITGIFMVAAGTFSDRFGHIRMAYIGIILSIIGSLLVIITPSASVMLVGRVIQGFSAAMLMPATIAILNSLFQGEQRRAALSWWSIGAFGGTGFASLFAGFISTYFFWQLIFILSIILSIYAFYLLRVLRHMNFKKVGIRRRFDYIGLVMFTISMATISIFITQGDSWGWLSPMSIILALITIGTMIWFYKYEQSQRSPFLDFSLFLNKSYTGVIVGNFLLNMSVGSIVVFNVFTQSNLGLTAFQSGLVTLPYVIMLLLLVRVGEKSIKMFGPKRALVVAPLLILVGVIFFAMTFFDGTQYILVSIVGFTFFGAGVGLFATPALDTAVSSLPAEKTGVASAIFKMASTLGQGFGIAILISVYTILNGQFGIETAASGAFIGNIILAFLAFFFIWKFLPSKQQ